MKLLQSLRLHLSLSIQVNLPRKRPLKSRAKKPRAVSRPFPNRLSSHPLRLQHPSSLSLSSLKSEMPRLGQSHRLLRPTLNRSSCRNRLNSSHKLKLQFSRSKLCRRSSGSLKLQNPDHVADQATKLLPNAKIALTIALRGLCFNFLRSHHPRLRSKRQSRRLSKALSRLQPLRLQSKRQTLRKITMNSITTSVRTKPQRKSPPRLRRNLVHLTKHLLRQIITHKRARRSKILKKSNTPLTVETKTLDRLSQRRKASQE